MDVYCHEGTFTYVYGTPAGKAWTSENSRGSFCSFLEYYVLSFVISNMVSAKLLTW